MRQHGFTNGDIAALDSNVAGELQTDTLFGHAFRRGVKIYKARNKAVTGHRSTLAARVGRFLGCEVTCAGEGTFWRADEDYENVPLINKLRALDDEVLAVHDGLFREAVEQVRHPNAEAVRLSQATAGEPVMTLACLHKGMLSEVSLNGFMEALYDVERGLRNV